MREGIKAQSGHIMKMGTKKEERKKEGNNCSASLLLFIVLHSASSFKFRRQSLFKIPLQV